MQYTASTIVSGVWFLPIGSILGCPELVDLVRTWVMTAETAVWLTPDLLFIWFITSDCRTHG